jgi:tRNA:m4X modification enzyme
VSIREALGKGQTSFKHWKHIEQDVAIINKLISNSLVQPTEISENIPEAPKNIYVEYGAGKGLLGYSINVIDPTAALVFVERSGNRRKIDKFLAERNCSFQRLKLDIRHCFLPKLPFIDSASPSTNITVVAKHLCGAATDLAIRSLSHIGMEGNGMLRKRGLAIATCCHHACTYDDYVGREIFLDECQITREEFDVLKYWAGWATLDDATLARKRFKNNHDGGSENASNDDPVNPEPENMAKSEEGNEVAENDEEEALHKPSPSWNESYGSIVEQILDYQEMLEIGRKIKRILDFGRLLYLAQNLKLSPKLLQYCDEKYSPECYLLLATEQDAPEK